MEPQWNPTLESQAIGRALRMGQQKQVTVVRYCFQNTVEGVRLFTSFWHGLKADCLQNIQQRQSYKKQLANLGFAENSAKSTDEKMEKLKVSIEITFQLAHNLTPFTGVSRASWHLTSVQDSNPLL
jgi:SWI/SNF-related matrix-associated actin-dependent regulator of chromatin subfamily A3